MRLYLVYQILNTIFCVLKCTWQLHIIIRNKKGAVKVGGAVLVINHVMNGFCLIFYQLKLHITELHL